MCVSGVSRSSASENLALIYRSVYFLFHDETTDDHAQLFRSACVRDTGVVSVVCGRAQHARKWYVFSFGFCPSVSDALGQMRPRNNNKNAFLQAGDIPI